MLKLYYTHLCKDIYFWVCVRSHFTYPYYYCFSTEGERGTVKLPEQGHFRAWERYGAALKRSVENGSASLVCHSRFASATCDTMMSSPREVVTSRQHRRGSTSASFRFTKCETSGRFRGEISRQMVRKIGSFGVFISSANLIGFDSTLIRCIAVLTWRFKYASLYTTPR